jgi:hypothetical protein
MSRASSAREQFFIFACRLKISIVESLGVQLLNRQKWTGIGWKCAGLHVFVLIMKNIYI